jgi:DMSO/TMAO reductase YedYZ molybdopterin-dependent catalytic subunit
MLENPDRRRFFGALAGTTLVVIGGIKYVLADAAAFDKVTKELRPDGRPRLPPNQYPLERLRPMGGSEGDPSAKSFHLKVHGEVEAPFELDFAELLALPQTEVVCDVHCVTKWTVLGAHFTGVKVADLAERARVKPSARHVIFECAHGYTSNIDIHEALKPNVLVANRYEGEALERKTGAPVRALVPDRYFWKSAKWLTGIRFSADDHPGYWEMRGYDNHADPWLEERYG